MKWMKILFATTLLLYAFNGAAMKPYRPESMIFVSPDQSMELHSPIYEKSFLIKKAKKEKLQWTENMNVTYVFSDPTSPRLFTVGGLGDSGTSLGVITFYTYDGTSTTVKLEDSIPNLEKMSQEYTMLTNFPWIEALDITDKELLIWVCDKVLASVDFKTLKVTIIQQKEKPTWAAEAAKDTLTVRAKKLRWNLLPE